MMEIDSGKSVSRRKNSKERPIVDKKLKKKESPTNSNVENIPKNNEILVDSPKSNSLLDYFSKLTPDQHRQQKHEQISKVTTKAEIHIMDKTSVQKFNGNSRDEKLITKKKKKSKISNCNQNFDEIEVLHSETITLSPIKINLNTISKSPPSGGKSKWSFKIKLQSDQPQNEFLETSGIIDEPKQNLTCDSSKSSLKENVKEFKKIPKCLLPIKNKLDGSFINLQSEKKENCSKKSKTKVKKSKNDSVLIEDSKIEKSKELQHGKEENSNSQSKYEVNELESKSNPGKFDPQLKKKGNGTSILQNKPETPKKIHDETEDSKTEFKGQKIAEVVNDVDEDLIYDPKSRSRKEKIKDLATKLEDEVQDSHDESAEKLSKTSRKRGRPRKTESFTIEVKETIRESKNRKVKSLEENKDSKVEKQSNYKRIDEHFKPNNSSETKKHFQIFNKVTSPKSIEVINIGEKSVDDDCQIIKDNSLKRKNSEKLAPIFLKKPKTVPIVTIDEAKQAFLKTEQNDGNNNKGTKKPIFSGASYLPFPKISHINQSLAYDKKLSDFVFTIKCNGNLNCSFDLEKFKNLNCKNNDVENNVYKLEKTEIETGLKEIETNCEDVPALWKYISKISKQENCKPQRKSSRRSKGGKNKPNTTSDESEILTVHWTDKYKPNNASDIVGNEEAAGKLKTWLLSWKQKKGNENYSSSEEFYSSDGSSSQRTENNQVAVLSGPHGSGKTAAVYAIAQELGYKVLEVNASSKRPGKKILKEFVEATKSHRVKETINTLDLMHLKKTSSENSKKISQNSLILMEDIDIIFEEDEGFISACFQLASNSKRPIIFTLKKHCSHLLKAAPEQLQISFEPAGGKRVNALLQLIVLGETGCLLSQKCANIISQTGDLRRSILQLQYLCLPKKEDISLSSLSLNKSLIDTGNQIYKSAVKSEKKTKKPSNLTLIANSIDSVSLLAILSAKKSTEISADDMVVEPSISLLENINYYDTLDNLGHEIQNWIEDATCPKSGKIKKIKESAQDAFLFTKSEVVRTVNFSLSHIPTHTLDRYALSVDYLPSIRTICRSEESRFKLNSKRGNRFFHYFQGTGLPRGVTNSTNVLMSACKMLREDPPVNVS